MTDEKLPKVGAIIRDTTGHRWKVADNTETDMMTGEPMIRVSLPNPRRTYLMLSQIEDAQVGDQP